MVRSTPYPAPHQNPFRIEPVKDAMTTEVPAPTSNVRRISETSTTNFVKHLKVGNQRFAAFIDSGSDRSLVRESTAHKLGAVQPCQTINFRGFA